MAISSDRKDHDPVVLSFKRMEANLHRLKQLGANGNPNSIWETAGHIWGAVYWLSEFTKDTKIISTAWDVRSALSQIISKNHRSNFECFDLAMHKITESYNKIQERI